MQQKSIWLALKRFLVRTAQASGSALVAFGLVVALSPLLYLPDADDYFGPTVPEDVKAQAEHFYRIWDDEGLRKAAHEEMREQNPEWDLISRSFYAYSLANVALKAPSMRAEALRHLDLVIQETVAVPWREFLLPYGHARPFVKEPAASLMVDGQVSLMIGLRRLVQDDPDYIHKKEHGRLIERCLAALTSHPTMLGETYPDECWLWCNPLALASIKVHDVLEGTDHTELFRWWEAAARSSFMDPKTGLLNSAITLDRKVIHPPEGSTIWIGAAFLLPVCPELAQEQYALIKAQLTGRLFCFRYGREWPRGQRGGWDIDSGFTPFGMGPASTGFGLVAAKEMGDRDLFVRLLGLLECVAVPKAENGRMRYLSSNLVGDATFLFAKTTGPAWKEIKRRERQR